jgi:hypothetical protein
MKSPVYYEKPPKRPSSFDWVCPEHWNTAKNMRRFRGQFIIEEHPIFAYSRMNPPAWLVAEWEAKGKK